MKHLYRLLVIVLFLTFSCNRNKAPQEVSENIDSLKISADRIVSNIGEILIPKAKEAVSEWREYNDVDEFMIKYYNISSTEALDHAEELSGLVQLMKDTIRVDKLKGLNVIARFNVLHNVTLRLADMATIPSISNEEVKEEVIKIIEVYSAVNSKINAIYKVEAIQELLEIDTETPVETKEDLLISKRKRLIKQKKTLNKRPNKKLIAPKTIEK